MSTTKLLRAARRTLLLALAVSPLLAASALADVTSSTNWAGYAVHRGSTRFSYVSAMWRIPATRCTPGTPTYSAMWVGLGGYASGSQALEQTGTESDCTASGRPWYSAWYELVPSNSRSIRMGVAGGDLMRATVRASGRQITLVLSDLTRRRSFRRTLRPGSIDLTSAEWIIEAPSECTGSGACRILPLANFGQTSFGNAYVRASGRAGAISSRWWKATSIILSGNGRRFAAQGGSNSSNGAVPSRLVHGGSGFTVTYAGGASQAQPAFTARAVSLTPSQPVRRSGS